MPNTFEPSDIQALITRYLAQGHQVAHLHEWINQLEKLEGHPHKKDIFKQPLLDFDKILQDLIVLVEKLLEDVETIR